MKPGEYFLEESPINANVDREVVQLKVSNSGDRPVQVGSHFHFFEVNRCLKFDREKAYGMRLNIPSSTAVRFEPGQSHTVELCALAGKRTIYGFNRLVEGQLDDPEIRKSAFEKMKKFCDDE